MPQPEARLLDAFGWSERVEAAFHSLAAPAARPGRVVAVDRGARRVVTDADTVVVPDPGLVVGDWVAVADDRIEAVVPRWSELSRLDPGEGTQVLAANVDVVLIAAPADRLSLARVERELVVAWDSGARPVVVITKADVAEPALVEEITRRLATADTIFTSAVNGAGLDDLTRLLHAPVTAVLLGPSGAGKSTLLNALAGEELLATAEVRGDDHRGRHTTTVRRLFPLPSGGCMIDMPGLRSLGLDVDSDSVFAAFPDIEELTAGCRFDDCSHRVEPQCAVLAAVDAGELDPDRLESFRKLQREAEWDDRRADPIARKAAVGAWKSMMRAGKQRGEEKRR